MPAAKKVTRRKSDPLVDKRKVPGGTGSLKKHNEDRHQEAVLRNRREGAAKARAKKMEQAGNFPVEQAEVHAILEQTLQDAPEDFKALCLKHGHNPMDWLFHKAKHIKDIDTKVEINKFLANKMFPNLKAVDVQKKMEMNVRVTVTSFKGARQDDLKNVTPVPDEAYDEFEEGSDDE